MLYFLDFQVEYSAEMSQQDLFTIWSEEADAAIGAMEAGVVTGLWKCIGERRVLAVVDVEGPDVLDGILFDLPLMQQMGQHVQVKVTSIRPYVDFAADVKERLGR